MPWLLLSFVVSFAIGWLAVSLLWPFTARASPAQVAFKISLGFGLGQGITACIAFLYLLINGRIDSSYYAFEWVVLAGLAIIFGLKARKRNSPALAVELARPESCRRNSMIVAFAFYATAATALATIALRLWRWPDGGWDAWMTWNLRARAIFRGRDAWLDAFSSLAINADYPVMLPMSVLRGWTYAGGETRWVPAALSWLFAAAVLGLVTSGVAAVCGRVQGYVAGVVLLGYGFFIAHASNQMPELPLMFFYAAAIASIAFYNEQPGSQSGSVLVLAGLAAGLGAWTKNEGLLFIVALGIAHFAVVAHTKGLKEYFKQALPLAAGLLPVLALVTYFKTQVVPPYIPSMTLPQVIAQFMDADRYSVIAREFARRFFLYEGPGINMTYMLLMLIVCFGVTRRCIMSVATGVLALTLMMAGFVAVYVALPDDPAVIMSVSVDRVLLQLWPAFVFAFFLLVGPLRLANADQPRTVEMSRSP